MSPNWLGTICAGASLVAFYVSHRLAVDAPQGRRLRLALAATILAQALCLKARESS
jgi:hypothetical protein